MRRLFRAPAAGPGELASAPSGAHSDAYRAARVLLLQVYTATANEPESELALALRQAALAITVGLLREGRSRSSADALAQLESTLSQLRDSGFVTADEAGLLEAQRQRVADTLLT